MGVRYRADWSSIDGHEYRIDIIDTDYSSTVNDLEIGMDSLDGFTITYEGDNQGRYGGLLASKCTINCVAEDGTFETFIDDIVEAQEQQFYVAIYLKDTTYKLFWAGLVLQDLVTIEDLATPYLFQLQASDGLGRLANIEYPATKDDNQTFIEYLITALTHDGISDIWGSGDIFLETGVDWYEDSMFTTSPASSLDPLAKTRCLNNAFMYENTFGDYVAISIYDVLQQICYRWHAVLIQSNGKWWFMQINQLYPSTFTSRYYTKAGSYSYSGTEDLKLLQTNFLRQGQFTFLPSLLEASVTYKYKQSVNAKNLLPNLTIFKTAVPFGPAQGGNGETLLFIGSVRCYINVGATTWTQQHAWVFEMKLQVGSYYYTNKNGYPEWSTTTTDRFEIRSPFWYLPGSTGSYNNTFDIAFETLPVPNSGDGSFQFDFDQFIDGSGNALTLPYGATSSFMCWNFILRQNIDDNLDSGEEQWTAVNEDITSNPVNSLSKLQLLDMLTGDGPNDYSDGRLQVYTTGSVWENSNEQWNISSESDDLNINELLAMEAMAAQRVPIKVYNGKILGINNVVPLAIHVLVFTGGDKYQLRSGSFNANNNEFTGDWIQVDVVRDYIFTKVDTQFNDEIINIFGIGSGTTFLKNDVQNLTKNPKIYAHTSILTSNHTIDDDEAIFYCNPGVGGLTLTLPEYNSNLFKSIIVINISATNTMKIGRDDTADLINASASDYTLSADTSIEIHNTGITGIGWATIFSSNRK